MRLGLLVLGALALGIGTAAGACSSFTPDSSTPDAGSEGGGDAGGAEDAPAAPDAAAGPDAAPSLDAAGDPALAPTPGKIGCFGLVCDHAANIDCCYDTDAGTPSCGASCSLGAIPIHCDDKSDCAPNEACCVNFFGSAVCQANCTGERLCRADTDCQPGTTCVPVSCRGSIIGACGPVGSYVKSFCNLPP